MISILRIKFAINVMRRRLKMKLRNNVVTAIKSKSLHLK